MNNFIALDGTEHIMDESLIRIVFNCFAIGKVDTIKLNNRKDAINFLFEKSKYREDIFDSNLAFPIYNETFIFVFSQEKIILGSIVDGKLLSQPVFNPNKTFYGLKLIQKWSFMFFYRNSTKIRRETNWFFS